MSCIHCLSAKIMLCVTLLCGLAACNSPPPNPPQDPPEPQASATQQNILQETINTPINRAKSVEETMNASADDALEAADAAVNDQ